MVLRSFRWHRKSTELQLEAEPPVVSKMHHWFPESFPESRGSQIDFHRAMRRLHQTLQLIREGGHPINIKRAHSELRPQQTTLRK